MPMSLPEACTCGGSFTDVTTHNRYEEDIPLPELTPDYQARLVTKYEVERGICATCGRAASARDLGGQGVTLGPNVRLLICHLVTIAGLSYAQTASLLLALYGLRVSDGEMADILAAQHQAWLPTYERLKANVRGSPIKHYDETPWRIQEADNAGYAWVMGADKLPDTVFHLASSRGARHARELHGSADGIRITDDYGVYRSLTGQQQLCWAHLYRVIRDLRYNANLPKEQLLYVTWWYEQFADIYQYLRQYLNEPYEQTQRGAQALSTVLSVCTTMWRRNPTGYFKALAALG